MSNPTTPFGWQMPTATDLVTDLPADFEVFGQAVATSLADLLGGTSGQVLAKNSNTDMDFVWVTSDDANAIQNTIVDAKGDLIGATAADTPARLAVGTNGQVLTADSTAATGLAWASPLGGSSNMAGKNGVLNSNFSIWQRGTSVSLAASTPGYTADRWYVVNGANQATTVSRQATGDTTNLPFIQYCARVQRNSGQTGIGTISISQPFETMNSVAFAGKTVTFSYYARKGADFSSATSALTVYLATGTGTDQNQQGAGYTGQVLAINESSTLTTTWQRFTHTATLATNIREIQPIFTFTPVGTASTNDYFEVTGVQLEIAASASAYSPNTSTQALEIAACQRYYFRNVTNFGYGRISNYGNATSATEFTAWQQAPVPMRATPTSIEFTGSSSLTASDGVGAIAAITNVTLDNQSNDKFIGFVATVASGLTTYRPYNFMGNGSATAYIAASAEL